MKHLVEFFESMIQPEYRDMPSCLKESIDNVVLQVSEHALRKAIKLNLALDHLVGMIDLALYLVYERSAQWLSGV